MTFLVTVQCVKSCGHWYSRVRRMALMLTMASIFCEVKADGFQLRGEDHILVSHRHEKPFWYLQQIWDDELSVVLDKRRHLLLRGHLLLAMGRPRDALEVVARMLLIPCAYPDQEKSDAHEALALALAEQGLLKDAVHHWLQASRTRYDINKQVLITKYST